MYSVQGNNERGTFVHGPWCLGRSPSPPEGPRRLPLGLGLPLSTSGTIILFDIPHCP